MKYVRFIFILAVIFSSIAAVSDPPPTRFTSGVTTVGANDPLGMITIPDPTKIRYLLEDFNDKNTAEASVFSASSWTRTIQAATAFVNAVYRSSIGMATGIVLDGTYVLYNDGYTDVVGCNNGALFVELENKDDLYYYLQENVVADAWYLIPGKELWFEAKINFVTDVTQADILVGLCSSDTTPLVGLDSGVYFQSDDGDAYLDFEKYYGTLGEADSSAFFTLVKNTWYTLSFHYDGDSSVDYWVNGTHYGTADGDYLPRGSLVPTVVLRNGEDSKTNYILDYIFVAAER